ncbi:hypothetical protein F2Q68_00003376 [Brassica cretica]|uniref:Uncharacterized protein n=1 Tax=Brassica cretica TaxID=69181 RepID=A0A8S9JKK0_BRACR|nr:hypothetical protein F2Q68_00003376 [Brassica cretica]
MNEVVKGCLLDWSFAGCNRLSKLDMVDEFPTDGESIVLSRCNRLSKLYMYLSGAVVDLGQIAAGKHIVVITASSLSKEPFGKKIGGHEKSLWA